VAGPPSCALPFSFCLLASYGEYSSSGGRNTALVTSWITPYPRSIPTKWEAFVTRVLWSPTIEHNLLRSPLHSIMLVVIFFPVPPSTRQAAGPLTENLPHVCLSDRKPVDLSLERPPLEEQSVVFARVFCPWSLLCCEYSWSASNHLRAGERN
jgi:hypothetical protein